MTRAPEMVEIADPGERCATPLTLFSIDKVSRAIGAFVLAFGCMKITPHAFFLAQQRCLLLAVAHRCTSQELTAFSERVEQFANAPKPDCPAIAREQDRAGLGICTDMLHALQRYFSASYTESEMRRSKSQ